MNLSMRFSVGFLLLLGSVATSAHRVGDANFTQEAQSAIDYRKVVAEPTRSCKSLLSETNFDYAVIRVEERTREDGGVDFCRVIGFIQPEISFVVELPDKWNGRFHMHGNGGFGGQDLMERFAWRLPSLERGFATAFTNTGHDRFVEPLATFAKNSYPKELDYGFRAVRLTTLAAKELIRLYYGKSPDYSYFQGCSLGGGQGVREAWRYPDDYDGIASGAPLLDISRLQIFNWTSQRAVMKDPLSVATVRRLGKYVLDRFDGVDGLVDGIIEDPLAVDFVPERDLPNSTKVKGGFTPSEITAISAIYAGTYVNGELIVTGAAVGSAGMRWKSRGQSIPGVPNEHILESNWEGIITPRPDGSSVQSYFLDTGYKYFSARVDDPDFDWRTEDVTADLSKYEYLRQSIDMTDPDLSRFKASQGKLLMYHGWSDLYIVPEMTVKYYQAVQEKLGNEETLSFFRLFMVPGMTHCGNGSGVSQFDMIDTLINWVEAGRVPEHIEAKRIINGVEDRTRPLCPYPQVARYQGKGSIDDAKNFRCATTSK
jgi:feruloyl esterase